MILNFANLEEATGRSRLWADAIPLPENRLLCRALGRWKMYLNAYDESQMPDIALDGITNPAATALLCDIVKPGMTSVDVGACFGYRSLLLSELVGDTGRVFAFEPNPRSFHLLKRNIDINGFKPRCAVYPMAIGAIDGIGQLAIHRKRSVAATLAEAAKLSFGIKDETPVKINRLDDLLGNLRAEPDVFLISTEGYEPQVWAGLGQLLQAKRKITILLEFTSRWYADPAKFIAAILDEGFIARRLNDDGSLTSLAEPGDWMTVFKSEILLTR